MLDRLRAAIADDDRALNLGASFDRLLHPHRLIIEALIHIIERLDRIMTGLDDLKAADAALVTAVNATVAYLQTLATTLTDPDVDVEAEAVKVAAQAAALQAAITPPAGPAPSTVTNSPVAPATPTT